MKGYFLAMTLAALTFFTVSCSGKYDNAIADYVANTEMAKDVKVKDVKELKKVTVGDSLNYLLQKAGQNLKLQIEGAEKQLTKFQQDLVALGTSSKVITEAYTKEMIRVQQTIDSLKAVKPATPVLYDRKNTEEVIAVVVEAKVLAKGAEETVKNFVLSPDGKRCYGLTENPDMSPEK